MNFPKRTIHLDFHTGPAVPDVAHDFDAESFARTFRDAHVDSVTVFATCHHGHAYWLTDRPERHPSLPTGLDLLGDQITALHEAGIKAPIYMSVQCNEFCANTHPDWIAITPEGAHVRRPLRDYFEPAWQIMDMSGPYQDYLADQLAEVLERYAPIDGLFMDMCWDQPSVSKWAVEGMRKYNLDPRSPADRAGYARLVAHGYMDRYSSMVAASGGGSDGFGVWFNSRPKVGLREEKDFIGHVEVEALPTGGWGYSYFPYVARYVRPLSLPGLSHTGRFFKSWGDNSSLKPKAALKYECSQILAQGLSNGVGDLLHPRGVPNRDVYALIGSVYEYIERCEPFVEGARHMSEAALVVDRSLGDRPGPSGVGAVRALQQLRVQFDVRDPADDLSGYRLLIVPETTKIDESKRPGLRRFIADGGAVILSGPAGTNLADDVRESAGVGPLLEEQGIAALEPTSHVTFLRARPEVAEGIGDYPYVMYEHGYSITPNDSATVLADHGEPYFGRSFDRFSGHSYTPFSAVTDHAAVVRNGTVVTFGVPILEAFGKHGPPNYKRLIGNVIDRLVPNRIVRDNGPSHMEVVVIETDSAVIAHVLSYIPERRADGMDIVEDPVPLVDVTIAIKCEGTPSSVTLQPHGTNLEWSHESGYVRTKLTLLDGHGMIVIER